MTIGLTSSSDLDYLITPLRLHIWDISEPYTYSDDTLRLALLNGFKALMPRWNFRYLLNYNEATDNWDITRNPTITFVQAPPPVIMYSDERPLMLGGSVSLKSGLMYTSTFSTVSWKDEEVSFANQQGAKMQEGSLIRDWEELNSYLPERGKRLASPTKGELPGFRNPPNMYEGEP